MLCPQHIYTARHLHPGVNSAADYEAAQRRYLMNARKMYPQLLDRFRIPFVHPSKPLAFISGGAWLVECECGNCPLVAPEWDNIARCFECGAVYTAVMPVDAEAIACDLIRRSAQGTRYWNPSIGLHALRTETDAMIEVAV